MGVLSGVALLNRAYEVMLSAFDLTEDKDRVIAAMRIIADKTGINGMLGGQSVDVENDGKPLEHKTLTPLLINAVVLALNIALNLVFRSGQSCGLIARTTAVSLTVGGVIALVCFFRDTRGSLRTGKLLKNLAAAVLTGAAMWGCETLLYRPELSKLLTLLEFCALGLIGIGLYAGICWLLREREALQTIVQKFRKRA